MCQIWEQSEVTQFFAKFLWSQFFKLRFRRPLKPIKLYFKLLSTKTLSSSSIQHCTSQLQTNYCFKTKRSNVKHNSESVTIDVIIIIIIIIIIIETIIMIIIIKELLIPYYFTALYSKFKRLKMNKKLQTGKRSKK